MGLRSGFKGCFGPKITGLRAKKGGESELI